MDMSISRQRGVDVVKKIVSGDTLKTVSLDMGCSPERVRQIYKKTVNQINFIQRRNDGDVFPSDMKKARADVSMSLKIVDDYVLGLKVYEIPPGHRSHSIEVRRINHLSEFYRQYGRGEGRNLSTMLRNTMLRNTMSSLKEISQLKASEFLSIHGVGMKLLHYTYATLIENNMQFLQEGNK